jgi:hypothetical protein
VISRLNHWAWKEFAEKNRKHTAFLTADGLCANEIEELEMTTDSQFNHLLGL